MFRFLFVSGYKRLHSCFTSREPDPQSLVSWLFFTKGSLPVLRSPCVGHINETTHLNTTRHVLSACTGYQHQSPTDFNLHFSLFFVLLKEISVGTDKCLDDVPGCIDPHDSYVAKVHTFFILQVFAGAASLAVVNFWSSVSRWTSVCIGPWDRKKTKKRSLNHR